MDSVNIFQDKFQEIIKNDVKTVSLYNTGLGLTEVTPNEKIWNVDIQKNLTCSYCKAEFSEGISHREHYKLDWHRFNLKQSLLGRPSITEDEFNEKNGMDDLSSISGSDSEKEDLLDVYATSKGQIFLQNDIGQVFSIYRCLLFVKKEEIDDSTISNRLRLCCLKNTKWTILMLGGGHFAGAVFQEGVPVVHKTFHCYTVRQGQGGSQSSRDNKSAGSHPKSAGASLRRYNEQALIQHVRNIIDQWKKQIAESSIIVYRASGPYNRSVLFGGSPSILDRLDPRLRTIPFSTRRSTFAEVRRVYNQLSLAQVYESLEVAVDDLDQQKSIGKDTKRSKNTNINRAKSREIIERPSPIEEKLGNNSEEESSEDEEIRTAFELHSNELEISFEHLQTYDLDPDVRKQTKIHKKKKPKKSKAKKLQEQEEARKRDLIRILYTGNVLKLEEMLENLKKTAEGNELLDVNALRHNFFNEILDGDGNSLLHIAAMNEHCDLVAFLMENDADPCLKNKKQLAPYSSTQSKDVREVMKQFSRDYPDKYDYKKAQIPIDTRTSEEIAEKKKALRKIKKEKEKLKKIENEVKKQENMEKDRYLKLSDREKRALAAERRILSQSGTVTARCFLCASDISGKVPFEYLGNRFCSIDCLKAHRMQNPVILS